MARNNLSTAQMFAVGDYLRTICKTVDGKAVYNPPHDDATAATEMAKQFPCTVANVKGVRKAMFGELAPKEAPLTIERLAARLRALEAWANARPVVPFRLGE